MQLSRGGDWFSDNKKFMQDPDPEKKLPSKSDTEPKKIIPDPQHWSRYYPRVLCASYVPLRPWKCPPALQKRLKTSKYLHYFDLRRLVGSLGSRSASETGEVPDPTYRNRRGSIHVDLAGSKYYLPNSLLSVDGSRPGYLPECSRGRG